MRNHLRKVSIIVGVAAGLSLAHGVSAIAAPDFNFSFDTGNVAFAYSDGYWDNDHHWHRWANHNEAVQYHKRFADHYHGWKHTRDADKGWQDHH